MRQVLSIVIGLVLSLIVVYMLWGAASVAHIDINYDELDANGKRLEWGWRIISVLVGATLFAWVVRKNTRK